MYISIPQGNKTLWSHTSLLAPQTHEKIAKVINGKGSFQNKATFFSTYLSLELVNRVPQVKSLAIYYRAGIVFGAFLGSRILSATYYDKSIQNDINKLADGAPVWENKYEVPELDKKFFFLDDDHNFQPSLWHHGITSIEKPKEFYKYA